MANRSLLPGFGGQYTTESIGGGATGADVIDASLAAQLAFQVSVQSGDSTTITVEQTFDGTHFATLTTFNSTVGTIKLLQALNAGPFGKIRVKANGTTGGNTVVVVGYKLPTAS